MHLIDFADTCNMNSKTTMEAFELMCYYETKENGVTVFYIKKILENYKDAGIALPDVPSLKKEVYRYISFRQHGVENAVRFRKETFRSLDKAYGHLWNRSRTVDGTPNNTNLRLKEFTDTCDLMKKTDLERFELLCYYISREKGVSSFHIRKMYDVFDDAEITVSDRSALKKRIKESGSFRTVSIDGALAFTPDILRDLNRKYGHLWDSAPVADVIHTAGIEVLPEERFLGRREALDRFIVQINETYRNGSYDACASVMRRLLEASLILSLRAAGKDNDIFAGGKFVPFDEPMEKASGSFPSLNADDLTAVSEIGDYSRLGPAYTFGAGDINSVRNVYRDLLDSLFCLSEHS